MRSLLFLVVALTLVATQSLASIKNTKHDLSKTSSSTTIYDADATEICVFCHTPHKADTSNTLAPLWNRSGLSALKTITDIYNSATLDSLSKGTAVTNAISVSDAPLCLTCHDGTYLKKALINPSNVDGQPDLGTNNLPADADVGTDLSNDHPIGMPYDEVQAKDTDGFNVESDGLVGGVLPLYTGDKVMWCSSCHDVHDNTNPPFLAANNDGSGLCLTCHKK